MKIPVPIASGPTEQTQQEKVRPEWSNWLRGVFSALAGWNVSLTTSADIDFTPLPAQTQTYVDVTVTRARPGDAVIVTPSTDTAGIIFTGYVAGNDAVRVLAKNFTSAVINPALTTFRIIVLQN